MSPTYMRSIQGCISHRRSDECIRFYLRLVLVGTLGACTSELVGTTAKGNIKLHRSAYP